MNIPRLVVIVVTFLLFNFSVYAQTPGSLTPQLIEGYINSIRDLREISKKYNTEEFMRPEISRGERPAEGNSPSSTAITQMQNHQAYDEILAVIERYGFSDLQQWGITGDRIVRAFAANSVKTEMPAMDEQMKEAMEQIEKSDMTDSQKDAMREMMQASMQMLNSYSDVSESDKKAVSPFMPAIEALSQQ